MSGGHYRAVSLLRDWVQVVAAFAALGGAAAAATAAHLELRGDISRPVVLLADIVAGLFGGLLAATPWLVTDAVLRLLRDIARNERNAPPLRRETGQEPSV